MTFLVFHVVVRCVEWRASPKYDITSVDIAKVWTLPSAEMSFTGCPSRDIVQPLLSSACTASTDAAVSVPCMVYALGVKRNVLQW